jgi:hypothetical protein
VHFGEPINRNDLIARGTGDVEDASLADGLRQTLSKLMSAEHPEPPQSYD